MTNPRPPSASRVSSRLGIGGVESRSHTSIIKAPPTTASRNRIKARSRSSLQRGDGFVMPVARTAFVTNSDVISSASSASWSSPRACKVERTNSLAQPTAVASAASAISHVRLERGLLVAGCPVVGVTFGPDAGGGPSQPLTSYSLRPAKNVIRRSRIKAADCSGGFWLQSTRSTSKPAWINRSVACR